VSWIHLTCKLYRLAEKPFRRWRHRVINAQHKGLAKQILVDHYLIFCAGTSPSDTRERCTLESKAGVWLLTTAQMNIGDFSAGSIGLGIVVLLPVGFSALGWRRESVCLPVGPSLWWGFRPTRLMPTVCEHLDRTLLPDRPFDSPGRSAVGVICQQSMSTAMSHSRQARDTRVQARSPRHLRTWIASADMCRLHAVH